MEFSQTCAKLISELKDRGHRLLCIIDNLDRLPAEEALEIWSAIRAIFANFHMEEIQSNHPFVLVPMDRSALLASFGEGSNDERTKSFIDKTFDLTFRVPPPVRSDWKGFLKNQMKEVFGDERVAEKTIYFIEEVFDLKHRTAKDFPTPRTINRFVNSVAATWLARSNDDFPLEVVAIFVAFSEEIEDSILAVTQLDALAFFDGDFPEWRDQVVAIYFGVPQKKSRQVLLDGPLRGAIEGSDPESFQSLIAYPGAMKVFEDIIRAYRYDPIDVNSQDFICKSATMLEAIDSTSEYAKRSWDFLLGRLVEGVPSPALPDFEQKIGPFLRNVSNQQSAKLINASVRWLSDLAAAVTDSDQVSAIAHLYDLLRRKASSPIPKIELRGEPAVVVNAIYWINGNETLESSVSVAVEFSKISAELATLVNDEDRGHIVSEVLQFRKRFSDAFPKQNILVLAPVRDAALARLETGETPILATYAAQDLGILAPLSTQSGTAIDAMIDAGHLQARLNEALERSDSEAVGVFTALAISRRKPFSADSSLLGDAGRLRSLQSTLESFVPSPLKAIWTAQAAGHSPRFMKELLMSSVRDHDFSTEELDEIASDFEFFFKPLDKISRHVLARKVGQDSGRIAQLGKLAASSLLLDILSPLVRAGVSDAKKQCRFAIEKLDAETWKSFLEGKSDWVGDLLEQCPGDFRMTTTSAAIGTALSLIDERAAALSVAERGKLRRLNSRFNTNAQRTLVEGILAHSQSSTKNTLALLRVLDQEASAAIATHLPSEKLVIMLEGLSLYSEGRAWLDDHLQVVQSAVKRFDRKAKNQVREWFRLARQQKPKARADWVELKSHQLGLDR